MDTERGEPKDNEGKEGEGFHPLRKVHGGMVVIAKSTGRPLSKHPLSPAMAHRQLGAVEIHKHHPGAA